MARMVVHYPDSMSSDIALEYARCIAANGRVSETKRGKQFCFMTTFNTGASVCCDLTRTGTDVFHISTAE